MWSSKQSCCFFRHHLIRHAAWPKFEFLIQTSCTDATKIELFSFLACFFRLNDIVTDKDRHLLTHRRHYLDIMLLHYHKRKYLRSIPLSLFGCFLQGSASLNHLSLSNPVLISSFTSTLKSPLLTFCWPHACRFQP